MRAISAWRVVAGQGDDHGAVTRLLRPHDSVLGAGKSAVGVVCRRQLRDASRYRQAVEVGGRLRLERRQERGKDVLGPV